MTLAPSILRILLSLVLVLFLSVSSSLSAPKSSAVAPTSDSPLDSKQIKALRSLNLRTKSNPCSNPSLLLCDSASPFRHVISLSISNCSDNNIQLSTAALSSLPNLTSFHLSNCHVARLRFLSYTKHIRNLTISDADLKGSLAKDWYNLNLTLLDFSNNNLTGKIPDSISDLETLESINLSSNKLDGEIPTSIGDISSLKNISLSSNLISGSVPNSIGDLSELKHLDLGSNQLNGTIPHSISGIKTLRYLNLEKNNFKGVMPFNASFLKRMAVFRIGGNSNLCYNQSVLPSKVKLGIAPCDKHGLPMSPPPAKDDSSSSDDSSGDDYDVGDESGKSKQHSHGTNKVVLGVAIGLSAVVFLIIFCVLISKCCR